MHFVLIKVSYMNVYFKDTSRTNKLTSVWVSEGPTSGNRGASLLKRLFKDNRLRSEPYLQKV